MLTLRTLFSALLLHATLFSFANDNTPACKEKNTPAAASNPGASHYTLRLDNTINKNNTVDSVLVILDKYDHSGAGIVRKVFHPDADNQVVIEDLPAGKYYAEIYVLGMYKKHFSTIIYSAKSAKKNKIDLRLDYIDGFVPGNANIPAENTAMFVYSR